VLGDYAAQQTGQGRALAFVLAAVVGMFLLLQAAVGNWRLAAVAFIALLAAPVGGVLAAFAAGGVLSLGALAGFLAVFAIAARNGIVLVHHYRRLEAEGRVAFGPALVLHGAGERLAPMVITALATGLALAPFAILGDIPGLEVVHPMAVVILGGLITSTLVGLFVLPAAYFRLGASPAPAAPDAQSLTSGYAAAGAAAD
jgi:Cu/Ag efflux pump CusA